LPAAPTRVPLGCWDAARAEQVEKVLDAFFAETDAAKRRDQYTARVAPLGPGLTLDELELMARAEPPSGRTAQGGLLRVDVPWLLGDSRGWFNLALPERYTPAKAWGLCVALHGSSGDGNSMVPFYSPRLGTHGYFVLYPTVLNKDHVWSTPAGMAHVYRLVEWTARRYRIDFRRLAISGLSMGGASTWWYLLNRPDLWHAGAAVAGYPPPVPGDALERLRGVPFYILHGDADTVVPVDRSRSAVEELQRRGIEVTYREAPGAGHTAPAPFWDDLVDWIARQPPKAWSPRPLFLPPPGQRPIWQILADPLDWQDDPAMKLIREGKYLDARADLTARLNANRSDARLYYLRALATLPGLTRPLPDILNAAAFAGPDWSGPDADAYGDLARALGAPGGTENAPREFHSAVHLAMAKVWAKRFATSVGAGGTAWADPFNRCSEECGEALRLNPASAETVRLVRALTASNPLRRPNLTPLTK
jgi:predicted esterase